LTCSTHAELYVAASPVSPVSTETLFYSLLACLALPYSTMARQIHTQGPRAYNMHVGRWDAMCWN